MRKNDLIKMLSQIKGNPEIVIWNGVARDWMAFGKLVESDLVKIDKKYFLESCRLEECIRREDWNYQLSEQDIKDCEKSYKNSHDWEDNPFVTKKDIKEKRYRSKRVVYIEPKNRGISTFDRLGGIQY